MQKLIVIEGCDGAGKSSCAKAIAKAIDGVYYKTPSALFLSIRCAIEETKDYQLRFYFFLASVLFASKEIEKILIDHPVVCDRYIYSTIAYHRALGVKIPAGIEDFVLRPDYAFCLCASNTELRRRVMKRKENGTFDHDFRLQLAAMCEFTKFPLTFINTDGVSKEESVNRLLQIIRQ